MEITKQLAVFLENRPGTLAQVCDTLEKSNLSILAISTGDTVDHNVVRMVVDNTSKALQIFEEHGTLVITNEVLLIDGANKPGLLAGIASKLADARINIDYCYGTSPKSAKRSMLVMRVSDPKKALKILNS